MEAAPVTKTSVDNKRLVSAHVFQTAEQTSVLTGPQTVLPRSSPYAHAARAHA